jgi:HopA1 effector protein family
MTDYEQQLRLAIRQTVFYSPRAYSCFGRQPARFPARMGRAMTARTAHNYLVTQLQSHLYSEFYVRGAASTDTPGEGGGISGSSRFIESLSAANTGIGHWESGWEVVETTLRDVMARKNGLTVCTARENCLLPPGRPTECGLQLKLRFPKELFGISPGYYFGLGNQEDDPQEQHRLARVYWNIQAEGAELLVRVVTGSLNEAHLFFKLKVLNNPDSYVRRDAGVLYLYKSEYAAVANILSRVYPRIANYLKPGEPAFAKHLAPGVGFAEDPGIEESFGLHRCRLLAEGLVQAYEQRAHSPAQRFRIVADRFALEGISLSRPYLNRNSVDNYAVWE